MGLGVIKKSFHKHLKMGGGVNAKVACKGEGLQRVSPSLPPPKKKFARTPSRTCRLTKYGPVLIFNSEEIM